MRINRVQMLGLSQVKRPHVAVSNHLTVIAVTVQVVRSRVTTLLSDTNSTHRYCSLGGVQFLLVGE
jgi:hypothetical protein